jgi:hypothetical protein
MILACPIVPNQRQGNHGTVLGNDSAIAFLAGINLIFLALAAGFPGALLTRF